MPDERRNPESLLTPPRDSGSSGPPEKIVQPPGEEEFGEMLESSLQARAVQEGETVRGTIVAIGPDVAFVDIGGKSEASIDVAELKDPEGDIEVEVGETIEAVVVSAEGGLTLSRKLARGAVTRQQIVEAFRAGLPVEGRVEKSNKGGYEVRIAGQRAFCPISQIDKLRVTDPAVHEGKLYTFRIIEYKDGGKNIVVSRRALLEEEEKQKAEETRKKIVPGAVLAGRVVSVREFGAFVDLGGVQGLLHISEMGWARVSDPSEIVRPGDEITVKVLRVDGEKGKIALGLKQLLPDPWSKVGETYAVGQVHPGRIVRVQDFGAFIELQPGIEALAHVSTFPPTGTPDGWKRTIHSGKNGMFEILSIDLDRKRIGVAMLEEGSARASATTDRPSPADEGAVPHSVPPPGRKHHPRIEPGARLAGKVEKHESYGVFVFLAPGRTGLMPASESGMERGADLKKAFPVGSEIEVVILEIDPSGKRIRLSHRAALEADEKAETRHYAQRAGRQESFGSLGEKLRAALSARRK